MIQSQNVIHIHTYIEILFEPTNEQDKCCQFEQIENTIFEDEARMVSFRTIHERMQPRLNTRNILYVEFYGNVLTKKCPGLTTS